MTLGTGTAVPTGGIEVGEDIYIDGGPRLFYQPYYDPTAVECPEANAPDSDGFYWALSGTADCPICEIACYEDISLVDTVTGNPVNCDAIGQVDYIEKRESVDLTFTVKSLLPFEQFAHFLRGGDYTLNATEESEKFGMGEVSSIFWHMFFSRVYDPEAGDYVSFTGHKAKFIDGTPLGMPYGDAWNLSLTFRLFADRTKPRLQQFGTWVRWDPSVL